MPQALIPAIVSVLGVSTTVATVIAAAVFVAAGLLLAPGGRNVKADQSERTIRSPKPARVGVVGTRRSYGAQMLFANAADGSTLDVWAYADEGPVRGIEAAYLNDDRVTVTSGSVNALSDGAYAGGVVLAGWNLGAATETAHAPIVSRLADWTSNHRGDGICSGYLVKQPVDAEDFLDVYPQADNVVMSLVVNGSPLPDPRDAGFDPDDRSTWTGTDNAALAHLWYRLVIKGDDYATRIAPQEALWIDAADDCDTTYALAAGGSEPKYRAWVMFDRDAEPADIEDEFRKCYDGWTAPDENGALKVYSGKVYTPTVSVGPTQIVDWSLQDGVEEENRVNQFIVRTISADHDWLEVECQPWRDETDILARGRELSATLNLQVPSHTQGRRIAKRTEGRVNAPQRGTVRVLHSAREALTERYINLLIREAGTVFFDDVVEVVGGERDYETGGATIEWRVIDPAVDDWEAAIEDGNPAPTQTKQYLAPLTTPTVSLSQVEFTNGQPRVAVTHNYPSGAGTTWFLRWRVAGSSTWNIERHENVTGAGILRTAVVPTDEDIEHGVAYLGSAGRTSSWSTTATVSTDSSGAAPSPNTAFTAAGEAGAVTGSWSNSTSSNFGHSELWSGPDTDFGNASQLGSDFSNGAGVTETFDETLAPGTYYLWTLAFNAADTASSRTGPIEVTVT